MTDLIDRLTDPVRFWTKSWRDHVALNPGVKGGISLALLKKHGGQKVEKADRERLAMGLHRETLRISVASPSWRPFSNADWMRVAGLADEPANPTKRLNEYVLGPYGLPDVDTWDIRAGRLHASGRNYARLIDALFKFTNEDHDQVCQRIFAGSSFAATTAEAGRNERLAAQLNELVAQTDKLVERVTPRASLEQLFRRTGEVKATMLRAGCSSAWWPYFGRDKPVPADAALPDPYWDLSYDFPYTTVDPSNPAYRYMLLPTLDWLDALIHLPRAYLGCAVHVPDWIAEPDAAPGKVGQLLADLYQRQSTLTEERKLATSEFRISAPGAWHAGESPREDIAPASGWRWLSEEGHCWLVIYPAKDRQGLCPLLYWSLGEGGVHVCSLDQFSMHAVSQLHMPGEHGVLTLVERIEQLLADPRRPLAQEWASTAFDLHNNPILVQERLASRPT